jgi:periplasmic protein CpxP/Spy
MRNHRFTLSYGLMLILVTVAPAVAQNKEVQEPSAGQQLQQIHTPQSIDQKLARLTKDLELTPEQQQQVLPLLEEHHTQIQALLDKNPTASRQQLGQQIHAISNETHSKIHALLTDHQKELEKSMLHREHNGEENMHPVPPATPPSDLSLSVA